MRMRSTFNPFSLRSSAFDVFFGTATLNFEYPSATRLNVNATCGPPVTVADPAYVTVSDMNGSFRCFTDRANKHGRFAPKGLQQELLGSSCSFLVKAAAIVCIRVCEYKSFMRAIVSEGIGTALLVAAVVGSGIMGERLSGGNMALALLANSIATGAVLVTLIFTFR